MEHIIARKEFIVAIISVQSVKVSVISISIMMVSIRHRHIEIKRTVYLCLKRTKIKYQLLLKAKSESTKWENHANRKIAQFLVEEKEELTIISRSVKKKISVRL